MYEVLKSKYFTFLLISFIHEVAHLFTRDLNDLSGNTNSKTASGNSFRLTNSILLRAYAHHIVVVVCTLWNFSDDSNFATRLA